MVAMEINGKVIIQIPDDLPTGYIGLVESKDGLNWNKVKGNKYKEVY